MDLTTKYLGLTLPHPFMSGASPLADKDAVTLDLRPVMTLESALIAVQPRKKGDGIAANGAGDGRAQRRNGQQETGDQCAHTAQSLPQQPGQADHSQTK